MKLKLLKEGGQALILISFAALGLFAIAGLAIDGSAKYSDRRHAQNAADTAALAGAYAKVTGDSTWQLLALNRAGENGYDDSHASPDGTLANDVYVYSPPQTGIYADCSDVHF